MYSARIYYLTVMVEESIECTLQCSLDGLQVNKISAGF
jgi:hypothetical protein